MKNVLVKKILLLAFLLSMMSFASAQSLSYRNSFNISEGVSLSSTLDVSGQVSFPADVLFNGDGTKMYLTNASDDQILQYTLSNPFDVSSGVTYNGALDVSGQEGTPTGVTISSDGSKLFVTGTASDDVHQYDLSTPYDVTTGVTLDGSVSVGFNPHDVTFNPDGSLMYVESNSYQRVIQYSLSSAYDITSGITQEGFLDHSNEVGLFYSFEFSTDGDRLIGQVGSTQVQYSLANPFDLTTGVTFEGKFYLSNSTNGMTFDNTGSRMYMSRGSNIEQYDLNFGTFHEEPVSNDGTTQSTASVQISGDQFTNAGGTLTHGVNYTIDNLPSGFTPVLDVSSNGLLATLSLTGSASSHAKADNLYGLQFTFENSAFVGNDASAVANATAASTEISIQYIDNNPTIAYGLNYNLNGSPSQSKSFSVSTEQTQPTGVVFSSDGLQMFISGQNGNDGIDQYGLSSAYDISTASHEGYLNTATENNIVEDVAFSDDGMKMFVLGRSGAEVNQYDLTSAFDITSTVSHDGAFSLTDQLNSPYAMSFSSDGLKMYVIDNSTKAVYQYSLSSAFVVTSGVTYDGSPFSIGGQSVSIPKGIAFNASGSRMLITAGTSVYQYRLYSPFDVTTAAEYEGISFSLGTSSDGITFNDDGSQMFVQSGTNIVQFNFATGGFLETIDNFGEVSGSLQLELVDDSFVNAGSTLSSGSHYTITGLPTGLTPVITVDSDAKGATLTFNGVASSHQDINDVTSLTFTFQDAAFESGDASGVTNAVGHSADVSLDFRDNNPGLTYGNSFSVNGLVSEELTLSTSGDESSAGGMTFSDDGMKLFIVGQTNDAVVQYSLSAAYDLSDVTVDGTYSISAQETVPHAVEFSSDGMTMFIMGITGKDVNQYSLTSAFDITSTVTFQGVFSVSSQESYPHGFRFSNDGLKLFVVGPGASGSDFVHQYSLTNAFDITSGVGYDGSPLDISGEVEVATGIAFNASGTRLFLANDATDQVHQYRLAVPFDVTAGAVAEGVSMTISGFTRDVIFSSDGSKMFFQRSADILQYDLDLGGFVENEDNVGGVNGSIPIQIVDDLFVNAGSTLSTGSHYSISNLPAGFTPDMSVNAEGTIATLTLNGLADDHQNTHDIAGLIIDFQDAAFVNSASSAVADADNFNTGLGIDFEDNNPKLIYGSDFDFDNASLLYQFTLPSSRPAESLVFSNDGKKLFALINHSTDLVLTYGLAEPFNVSAGISLEHSLNIGSIDTGPSGIKFSDDGMRMFIVGILNKNVAQLALNAAFDLSQGFSTEGSLDVSSQDGTPEDIHFSSDGMKLFVVGRFNNQVYQYSLTNAFDVTTGVTYDGSHDVSSEATSVQGLWFDPSGNKMFVSRTGAVVIYNLDTPYEITSGVTYDNQQFTGVAGSRAIAFSDGGEYLYTGGGTMYQYDLGKGGFMETETNIGEVEGELVIILEDEVFANAGGTLTETVHYFVGGVPPGLSPNVAVASDGLSATLTFTSSATDHQDANDVSNLVFTFSNSAFTQFGDASRVENAITYDSNIGVDFTDNNPTVRYGFAYDISNGIQGDAQFRVGPQETEPSGMVFSPDGTKLFIVGIGAEVNQYSLTAPFEISGGVSHDGIYDLSGPENSPKGIAFNNDGTLMFIVGTTAIREYTLDNAFDITSGVTYTNALVMTSYETNVEDIVFNPDGSKMYIVGSNGIDITQFTLNTPFDISDVVTQDGVPFSVFDQESAPRGMSFSTDGFSMAVIGGGARKPHIYRLTKPFDLTAGVVFDATLEIFHNSPGGIVFSSSGDKIFTIDGSSVDRIRQFNLNVGGFNETQANDGNIEGSLQIHVFDEQFSNGGGTLTETTDYTITGLPAGLTPNLAVAADGLSATLTLSGSVADHQLINSVDDLIFTFENSAFAISGDAASVTNAVSASSHVGIDFNNNTPVLTYGSSFDLTNGIDFGGSFSITNETSFPEGLAFSKDGMSMFVSVNKDIYQYSLTAPFDLAGASLDGSFEMTEVFSTSSIAFSSDGMKMFLPGTLNSFGHLGVYQYSLTTPFTVTSGASYDGLAALSGNSADGITFSLDGTRMFIMDRINKDVFQYAVNSPFSILSGISLEASYDVGAQDSDPRSVAFSANGKRMFVVGATGDEINEYALTTPYDLSSGVSVNGGPITNGNIDSFPVSIVFSTTGHRIFVLGSTGDNVSQFNLQLDGFTESASNDGSMEGTLVIELTDDTFANAGGTLSSSTDYSINNLPSGLTPVITVAGDGLSATLTFSDNATNHMDSEDVANLEFTFENSAFVNYDAVDVTNAVAASSHVGLDFIASTETDILTFTLAEETGSSTIDAGNHTVDIEVPFGTDVSALTPTITVSEGATISPESDVEDDFTNPVTYTVTAEDGTTTQDWEVTVAIAPNTENDIESFTFAEIDGSATIDEGNHTVVAQAVAGTDISAITPTIGVSQNGSIAPNSEVAQDFTSAVTYTVTAEDGGTQDWDVTITEVEVAPTDIILTSTSVDENSASGTVVAELSSLDANFNETFTYYVVAVLENDDWQSFDIDGTNLITTNFISLDFETKNEFTFELEVRDSENEAYSEMVTITLNDVNEAPTDILLDNTTVDESNPAGTVVGGLSVADEDLTDNHTYTLKGGVTDNASFDIDGDQLVTAVELDFETKSSYTVEVIVTDQGDLTFEKAFVISVNDLPAQVTSVALSNSAINENSASGTTVGTMSTFGEDLSGSYTYTLVSGTGDTDNGSFSISGNQLLTTTSFDFETQSSYSIRMMTDDGGGNTLEQAFTIEVNDVSEAPTNITLVGNSIVENNSIGEVIGTLSTTDEDAGESYTYSLVAGTGDADNASFFIVGDELQAAVVFDFEIQSSYSIRVQTNDGNGGTYEEAFSISITNENEGVVVANAMEDQSENEGFGSTVIDISNVFEDIDGDALTYTVSSSSTAVVTVSISGTDLTVTEVSVGSSTITVYADDGSGVSTSDEFIFTVEEAPLGLGDDLKVKVYPNPTVDFLNVGSSNSINVMLIDLNGRTLQSANGQNIQMDLRAIEAGLYLLKISDGESTETKRIIKAN